MPSHAFLIRLVCGALFWLSTTLGLLAQTNNDLHWDPRLIEGRLSNGLRYVIHASPNDSDPFNLRLIVNAGSVDEVAANGIAHIVEHMVFRSTEDHPGGINAYLKTLGWRLGLQINARTRATDTQYMIRTRPNDSLDLDGAMALLAQLAFHARMRAEDWDKERFIVLEELRQRNSVALRVNDLKKKVVRFGSRYANGPIIGEKDRIENAAIDDIRAFYETHYRASNMALVVSGAVDPVATVRAIHTHFASAPRLPATERPYVKLPLKTHLNTGLVQDPEGTSSRVAFGLRFAMPPRDDLEGLYAYLQNYFLRRLMRSQLRARLPLYSDTIESLSVTMKEVTNERCILAFAARSDQHDAALDILLSEIEYLRQTGLSEEGFEELRDKAIQTSKQNIKAAAGRGYALWEDKITAALMQETVLEAPQARSDRNIAWIEGMTLEELNTRMREILQSPDQFLYYQAPGDAEVTPPEAQVIKANQQALAARDLVAELPATPAPKEEAVPVDELPPLSLPDPLGETEDSGHQELPIVEWDLPNGDRIVWLQRPTPKGNLYIQSLSSPGHTNTGLPEWLPQTAIQLWQQSGFDFWDRERFEAWRSAQPARWDWKLSKDRFGIAIATLPENLEGALHAYHVSDRNGRILPDAISAFQEQMREKSTQMERPRFRLGAAMTDMLYSDKQSFPNPEALETLTKETLENAARTLLSSPKTWFIVGQAEECVLRELFLRYVAPLERHSAIVQPIQSPKPGTEELRLAIHRDHRASVRMEFHVPMAWYPEKAFLLSSLTPLTQEALKAELRHRLGGIYTLKFELKLDRGADHLLGRLSFVTAPERVDELVSAAKNVLRDMPQIVANADAERIRDDIRHAEALRLKNPNTWLRRMALSYERYGDARYLTTMTALPDEVTQGRLQELARETFVLENTKTAIGLPHQGNE